MLNTTTTVPECGCPNCGGLLANSTAMKDGARPKPGDIGVCGYCGHFCRFDDQLFQRDLEDHEFQSLPHKTRHQMLRLREAVKTHPCPREEL